MAPGRRRELQVRARLKWKFGLAYDQSPVHKEQDRPTSLPDNDRYWFSTGVQWQATKNTTLDVGYTYLYLRKTYIDTNSGNALPRVAWRAATQQRPHLRPAGLVALLRAAHPGAPCARIKGAAADRTGKAGSARFGQE